MRSGVTKSSNLIVWWLKRVAYRIWQFKQTILPKLSAREWQDAVSELPEAVQGHLMTLKKSEKAHVLRVRRAIAESKRLNDEERQELLQMAMLHDIGKAIARSGLVMKVARVFFPISRNEHCVAGARLLHRLGFERKLVRRVLRHHTFDHQDRLLAIFQEIDDNC
jgi:putative nucleotidyltransferase with HDIG domain